MKFAPYLSIGFVIEPVYFRKKIILQDISIYEPFTIEGSHFIYFGIRISSLNCLFIKKKKDTEQIRIYITPARYQICTYKNIYYRPCFFLPKTNNNPNTATMGTAIVGNSGGADVVVGVGVGVGSPLN